MSTAFSLLNEPTDSEPYQVEPARIAGFWRRLLGFLIDCLILGIVGLVIGSIFFDTFAALGGWGKLVGFTIALAYFGILNSSIGGGQTFGKRLVNIKVVNREGGPISIHRSLVRYVILGTPYFLNGVMISAFALLLLPFISVVIFGGIFAILYLYIFNRRTRQSLHDLATDTLVVRATDVEPPPPVHIWKYHILILSGAAVVMLLAVVSVSVFVTESFGLADLATLQEKIHDSGQVHFASVFIGKVWGPSGERSYLKIDAVWKSKPDSYETATSEIAAIAIGNYPDISSTDVVVINIVYGFDIGIASSWQSYNSAHSPDEWKRRLE
jgi:uncharacterized RDD family membrane protein YckC